jgi:TorA maturation chaperone TorD
MNAAEVAEIFETISSKIPEMINGVLGSLFSVEAASNMGKAVAEFRKSLIEGGIPEAEAMEMTRDYLGTLTSWSKMMREVRGSKRWREEE